MSQKTFSMIGCGDVQSGNSWSKKRIATLPTVSYYHLHSIATTFFFLADFFLSFSFLCCLYIISVFVFQITPLHSIFLFADLCAGRCWQLILSASIKLCRKVWPPWPRSSASILPVSQGFLLSVGLQALDREPIQELVLIQDGGLVQCRVWAEDGEEGLHHWHHQDHGG